MKTSRAFMTAVPLALLLIAVLATLVAVTPAAFRFDRWPDAPRSALSEREVVVDVPVARTDSVRADARKKPSIEREGATLVVREPKRLERRDAPAAAPDTPQIVADSSPRSDPEPDSAGDGVTSSPAAGEPEREGLEPLQAPIPQPPALPAIPAKDLPGNPDPVLPQFETDISARPRDLEDDQE